MQKSFLLCISCAGLILVIQNVYSQETTLATGGEAVGGGGSSSYSIGQVAVETNVNVSASITEGVQQPFEITQGIGLEKTEGINLFCIVNPNPATTSLKLDIENYSLDDLAYSLYDMQGKLLESKYIAASKTVIAMHHLSPGLYMLFVYEKQEIIKSFKVIKY